MWRKLSAVLLLVAVTHPAMGQSVSSTAEPCEPERVGFGPFVDVHQSSYNHVLPRGKEENVAIVLFVPSKPGGYCCSDTPTPDQPGLIPVSVQLQPRSGLKVRYRAGVRYHSYADNAVVKFAGGQQVMLLKVRADGDMPVGPVIMHGTLIYRRFKDGKPGAPEEIPFVLSTTIAPANVKMESPAEWPFGTQVKKTLRGVALIPVEIPAALLMLLACGTGNRCAM